MVENGGLVVEFLVEDCVSDVVFCDSNAGSRSWSELRTKCQPSGWAISDASVAFSQNGMSAVGLILGASVLLIGGAPCPLWVATLPRRR